MVCVILRLLGVKEEDVRARLGDRLWYLYAEPNDSSLLGAAGVVTQDLRDPTRTRLDCR